MAFVQVPANGEFYVKAGKVYVVLESERTDVVEDAVGYTIWLELDEEGNLQECGV